MSNSLIQGTTWYWRKGRVIIPLRSSNHASGPVMVQELCLMVDTPEIAERIAQELKQHNISVKEKKTHASSTEIPSGSLILYARKPNSQIDDEEDDFTHIQDNLNQLKKYIQQNGGKIQGESPCSPLKKFNLFRFLKGGRK